MISSNLAILLSKLFTSTVAALWCGVMSNGVDVL